MCLHNTAAVRWICRRTLIALLLVCLLSAAAIAEDRSALDVARRLARSRFRGFSYGSDTSRKQVDCVQFLAAVVEEILGRPLSKAERDAVYIDYNFEDLQTAVSRRDPRTKGVVRAVAGVIACGREVPVEQVRPNDIIQYWYRSAGGQWLGHASIVSRVWRPARGEIRVAIFGSHKSTNGIADNDFGGDGLLLTKPGRIVYVARIDASTFKRQ